MAYAYVGTVFAEPIDTTTARPGLLLRMLAAVTESKSRRANAHIAARAHLFMESRVVLDGLPQTRLGLDARLPFIR